MTAATSINRAFRVFAPRPRVRTLDWAREHAQTYEGHPYNHSAYPHLGAPGGPLDAFDCAQVRVIVMQFGSRLGKTFGGQTCTMKQADYDPCPMMLVSSDQKLATEVTARKYGMLERCPPLRGQLRPVHRRKQSRIELDACREYVGWAKSVSTLADKAVKVGHANEIDKWEHTSTSKEADPLELFLDRFKEFPAHKAILESTPALKHTSRIERRRLASTNCQYQVPCPHCAKYQKLRMGDGVAPGGIVWEKKDTRNDKDVARATARYVCLHCEKEIRDEHRGTMMRAGVWVPEGCGVDDEKAAEAAKEWRGQRAPWRGWKESPWITGTPVRDGRDAGYQLSSLYALSLSWGDIAAKFVECHKNAQNLRNFVNQWLAETWETVKNKTTWEQLGTRIIGDVPPLVCPPWASMLTMGVDRQEACFPWVVEAWGPERRSATIAYGEAEGLEQIRKILTSVVKHADNGPSLPISFCLVDSGFRPDGIYDFCVRCLQQKLAVYPSKGSNVALESDYRAARLGDNTSLPGMLLYHIDTIRSQLWVENQLHSLKSDDPGGYSLYAGSLGHHQDFLEQLLNDAAVSDLDSHNNPRESWDRINTNIPNDYRDCRRMAYVAMLIRTRGKPIPARTLKPAAQKRTKEDGPRVNNIIERPGGWIQPRRNA